MPSLPQILIDFAGRVQNRFGGCAIGYNDGSLFIVLEYATVHVCLDQNSNRAVVWSELRWPDQVGAEALERAAVQRMTERFLDNAMTVGVNREQDLILLGRSFDQQALGNDDGIEIVAELVREASVAARELAAAALTVADTAEPRPAVYH